MTPSYWCAPLSQPQTRRPSKLSGRGRDCNALWFETAARRGHTTLGQDVGQSLSWHRPVESVGSAGSRDLVRENGGFPLVDILHRATQTLNPAPECGEPRLSFPTDPQSLMDASSEPRAFWTLPTFALDNYPHRNAFLSWKPGLSG